MAWTSLATASYAIPYPSGSVTYAYTLQEDGTGGSLTLRPVQGARKRTGNEGAHPLEPILPGKFYIRLRDEERELADIIEATTNENIRLTVTKGGNSWFKGTLENIVGGDRLGQTYQTLECVFDSGLEYLREVPYDPSAWVTDETGYSTVAEAFGNLLNTTRTELPTRIYFNWDHDNYDTAVFKASAHRFRPIDLVSNLENPTTYDALESLARTLNIQVLQSGGHWRCMQRSYRGTAGNQSYVEVSTAGVVTTSSEDLRLALTGLADGDDRPFQRRLHLPVKGFVSKQVFEQYPALRNQDFSEGTPPAWEHWTNSGVSWTDIDGGAGVEMAMLFSSGDYLEQALDIPVEGNTLFETDDGFQRAEGDTVSLTINYSLLEDPGFDNLDVVSIRVARLLVETSSNTYSLGTSGWTTGSAFITRGNLPGSNVAVSTWRDFDVTITDKQLTEALLEPGKATFRVHFEITSVTGDNWIQSFRLDSIETFTVERSGIYARARVFTSDAAGHQDTFESTLGDALPHNPVAGNLQYLDDTSGAWEYTTVGEATGWAGDPVYLHNLRIEDAYKQLQTRLNGLEAHIALVAGNDVQAHHTATYDSVLYVPVCSDESDQPYVRKMILYPVLAGSAPATDNGRYEW